MRHYIGIILLLTVFSFSCKPSRLVPDSSTENQTENDPLVELDSQNVARELVRRKEHLLLDYQGSRERKFDLLHTSLDLRFDYSSQQVIGEARLTLKPYFFDQNILELDARDFDVHDVWLEEDAGPRPLAVKYNQHVAELYLPRNFTAEDTLTIVMFYTARPNSNSGSGSKAITDNKGLYFINPDKTENKPVQIWTQGETAHNSKWFPTIDSPNERATHDIKLTVEKQYLTISNGELESQVDNDDGTRTDHWVMNKPHAPYLTAIVVGEFATIEDTTGKVPLRYFVEEDYRQGAKRVFENTPEMVVFFSEILGVEFPWQKYDQVVVRDFVSGAMENTTASIFMEALNMDEREAIDSEWDYIIAHELFHQWFGNLVTLESWGNLPLNEAFADYSEYLWMEHKNGKDKADMQHVIAMEQYFAEAQEKQVDLIRYYYQDSEDMFDSHSYAKGGRVLHMLRRYLGDSAFFTSLNYYLKQHAFSSVEIHDLRMAFEKITGMDLNWFFNQWFLSSGHPVLDVKFDHSQPDNILLTVRQTQDLPSTPLYKIPFKVSWYTGEERNEAEFVLNQAAQQFALENGKPVDLVMFDESKAVLSENKTYYGRDHFEKQAQISQSGIARYEALDSLSNNYPYDTRMGNLLNEAMGDSFSSVRELALAKLQSNLDSTGLSDDDKRKIETMAEADPDNKVRAGAVELLSKIGKDEYAGLFLKLMTDSSYYVAGAALTSYLENDNNKNRDKLADQFLDSRNIQLLVPLADYMTEEGDVSKIEWFHSQLNNLSGESLYYFIGYYGDYFARLSDLDHGQAVENLFQLSRNNSATYVRVAAFQSLFGFIDETGVLEKVKVLHAEETDDKAKAYQRLFLESYVDED